MPIVLQDFLEDEHVQGFIQYFADVICGDAEVNHEYLDRFLVKRARPYAQRTFQRLEDAFDAYYWPEPDDSFSENIEILEPLKIRLRNARAAADNEDAIFSSIARMLWWGAGNKGTKLYTGNMTWLQKRIGRGTSATEILDDVEVAFDTESFEPERFSEDSFRSNAGYTKKYALMKDDFVIYDSRVAAAIGLLVVRYCDVQEPALKDLPHNLVFGRSSAAGNDNRDPSQRGLEFPDFEGDHSLHASSNWRANIVLSRAIALLEQEDRQPAWMGENDPIRNVEAALFMLGKHIPLDDK